MSTPVACGRHTRPTVLVGCTSCAGVDGHDPTCPVPMIRGARPELSVGRHTREYLWNRTEVIVLGNKPVERGGIPGTFWRVPVDFVSWDLVIKAGGPGAIASGTVFDHTLRVTS